MAISRGLLSRCRLGIVLLTISFVSLEISLQAAGLILRTYRERYQHLNDTAGRYRILALGESTTADLLNGESPWPKELQHRLDSDQRTQGITVINEGIPGTDTGATFTRLEALLDRYNPNLVVTMMGVNDVHALGAYAAPPTATQSAIRALKSLRTVRLALNIRRFLIGYGQAETETQPKWTEETGAAKKLLFAGEIAYHQGRLDEAVSLLRESASQNPEGFAPLLRLGTIYTEQSQWEKAEAPLKRSFELRPSHVSYLLLSRTFEALRRTPEEQKAFFNGLKFDPEQLSKLNTVEFTKRNYVQIATLLRARRVPFVAMSYPTLDISLLKEILSDFPEVIFVENKQHFLSALQNAEFRDLFVDSFAAMSLEENPFRGSYGHLTTAGAKLIAGELHQRIVDKIPPLVP